jgi:hypothetical protein
VCFDRQNSPFVFSFRPIGTGLIDIIATMVDNDRNASVVSGRRIEVDETKLHVTSVFAKRGEHAVLDHIADADEEILVALGYKQEFKRHVCVHESATIFLD